MIDAPKKEIVDQSLHIMWCWLSLAPAFVLGGWFGFALTGWMLWLIREISQRGVPVTWTKIKDVFATEKFDMIFWTLGGFLFWLFFV